MSASVDSMELLGCLSVMAKQCSYFSTAAWTDRLTEYIGTAWDIETYLRHTLEIDAIEVSSSHAGDRCH